MSRLLIAVLLVTVTAGCESMRSGPSEGYLNPDDDVFGRAGTIEYTQLRIAMVDLLDNKMKTDPRFTRMYKKACERAGDEKHEIPTIAVRPIENNTGDGRSDSEATGQIYNEISEHLGKMMRQDGKTPMFELIDYAQRSQMKRIVPAAVDDGEAPNNLQHIGNYTSADFIMTGELKRSVTEDKGRRVYHHFLNLKLTSTSTGMASWTGSSDPVVKFEAR